MQEAVGKEVKRMLGRQKVSKGSWSREWASTSENLGNETCMGQTGKTPSIQSSPGEKSGFCQKEDANCLLGQTAPSLVGSCAGQTGLKDLGGLRQFLPEMAGCPQTISQRFCVSRSFLPYKTREVTRWQLAKQRKIVPAVSHHCI